MRTYLVVLLVLVPLSACGDGSPSDPGNPMLPVETLADASYSGFSTPQRRTIRDEAEWTQVWQTLHEGQQPVPARPAVDFDEETVVLVAAGSRSNGCYSIEVTRATLTSGGTLQLEVTETVPGGSCSCTQAITQPAHVVRIDRVVEAEVYLERQFQRPC